MKKRKNDIMYIFLTILAVVIFAYIQNRRQNSEEIEIAEYGVYTTAIIYDEMISRGSHRTLYFNYNFKEQLIKRSRFVSNDDFFDRHHIGDTILIKFLPNKPSKSVIIENVEYKTCFGLPSENGWLKIPTCDK